MKTRELMKILDGGGQPVIRFNNKINELDIGPDNGMMGRVLSYHSLEEDGDDCYITLIVEVNEFRDINEPLAVNDYFNNEGGNDLTWFDTELYPIDGKLDIYEMVEVKNEDADILYFDLVDSFLVNEFKKSNATNYIQFLESIANHFLNPNK